MDLAALNDQFGIPGSLRFEEVNGLQRAEMTTPEATATVYLQGAQITRWQPTGQAPILFLSADADLSQGKPIRGGIPISFPWFAEDSNPHRHEGKPGPSHGFARIQPWTIAFAALSGSDVYLLLTLEPTQLSRDLGFVGFRLAYGITIGHSLTLQVTVANDSDLPLVFEEALHTYFAVQDVRDVSVAGLEPVPFIDKTDGMLAKPATHAPLTFSGPTDRVYPDTSSTCILSDQLARRWIKIAKLNSETTVVFNPWRALPDLGSEQWQRMLCVETANAGRNAITLPPRESHTMQANMTFGEIEP